MGEKRASTVEKIEAAKTLLNEFNKTKLAKIRILKRDKLQRSWDQAELKDNRDRLNVVEGQWSVRYAKERLAEEESLSTSDSSFDGDHFWAESRWREDNISELIDAAKDSKDVESENLLRFSKKLTVLSEKIVNQNDLISANVNIYIGGTLRKEQQSLINRLAKVAKVELKGVEEHRLMLEKFFDKRFTVSDMSTEVHKISRLAFEKALDRMTTP